MKKLTRIFFAVAALVAVSCTTDATNDLGLQIEGGAGQTTLTLSLEESRTVLGAEVNGLYPVAWCAEDAISVNGVTSTSIAIDSNASVATFSFPGVLNYPYSVAYPAANEGKVIFADQQSYTEGTFTDGAAVMYGYAEAEGGIALKHLTGVLKIGVTGEKTLSFAQISNVDRAPIAGEFALNFAEGEVEATTSSKELINYSFGEGVELSSTPTYLHIAVPAGKYDELYVTLYDTEGGVMYATVKAGDSKPLAAGKIREFSNTIAYAPNASVFVIKDVATLKAFAEQAADLYKDVLFIADVDMTGEAWTPIEGYSKTVLGNGFAIKGLTAPLFNETSASIKGLHLTDVNLASNDAIYMGAFANKLTANDTTNPVIEHCSASGVMTVKNANFASTTKNDKNNLFYGGIVGYALGVEISNCVNKVKINVEQTASTAATVAQVGFYGGVVGYITRYVNSADSNLITYSIVKNCTNQGAIYIDEKCWELGKGLASHFVGGVVAFTSKNNVAGGEIKGCVNDAPITLHNPNNHGDGAEYTMVGGIVGYTQILNKEIFKISDCVNTKNGKMTVSGKGTSVYIGGIGGYVYNCDWTNVTNYADIECPAILSGHFYIAGCLSSPGVHDSDANHIYKGDNINNYGNINVTGAGGTFYVAGVFGRASQGDVSNANNYGAVTVKPSDVSTMANVIIGGLEATGVGDGDAGSLTNCHNYAPVYIEINGATGIKQFLAAGFSAYSHRKWNNCSNEKEGTLTIKGAMNLINNNILEDTTTDSNYAIGAMCGYRASQANANSVNYADVTIDVAWTSSGTTTEGVAHTPFLQIGGMFGRTHQNIPDNCRSYCTLKVGGSSDNSTINMAVGGLAGSNIYTSSNWINDCDVYISGNHHNLYAGGCLGYSHGYKGAPMTGAVNNKKLYIGVDENGSAVGTTFTLGPKVGGVIGYTLNAMTDCINEGEIRYKANRSATGASGTLHVGGAVGYAQAEGSKACNTTLTRVTNNAKITIEGDNGACEVWAGGINGYLYGKSTQTGLVNNGELTVNMDSNCTGHFKIGGISGGIRNAISDSENNGKINILGNTGKTIYLGGIVANANGYHRTNLTNNGDIYVDANVKYDCFIGGITYDAANGNPIRFTNCHNTGDITVSDKTYVKVGLAIGGLIAKYTTAEEKKIFIGCSNSGNIYSGAKTENAAHLGGFMGYASAGIVIIQDGFVNSGNITHAGSTNGADAINVGGLFGYITGAPLTYDTTTTTGEGDEAVTTTTTTSWSGDIVNKGTITGAGASGGGKCRFGGIVGLLQQPLVGTAKYINVGDIVFTGTAGIKNDVPGTAYLGGLVGQLENASVDNGEVYCSISAGESKNYGYVLGVPRTDAVKALNCKVGGTLLGEYDEEDEEYKTTTLDTSNFYNYIYSTPVEQSVAEADGCSVLTAKPIQ